LKWKKLRVHIAEHPALLGLRSVYLELRLAYVWDLWVFGLYRDRLLTPRPEQAYNQNFAGSSFQMPKMKQQTTPHLNDL
jgi:hypothetical protein